jgi:para-aminobenzoate synthetase/4-amino-4-deoxychorismate lyase
VQNELSAKAAPGRQLKLIETMYVTRNGGVRHFERHTKRLVASAARLQFPLSIDLFEKRAADLCAALPSDQAYRARVTLDRNGQFEASSMPLSSPAVLPVKVLLAPEAGFTNTESSRFLLAHKSTDRDLYDRGWRYAEEREAFDMLFFNERDELTEGSRSNVFVRMGSRWFTPPLECGLLPGVMRSVLLETPSLRACERAISRNELLESEELIVCNAVQGALPASLVNLKGVKRARQAAAAVALSRYDG